MKRDGILALLRLRKIGAGEARRALAAAIQAENRSEAAAAQAEQEFAREAEEIAAQSAIATVPVNHAAYMARATTAIAQKHQECRQDRDAHSLAAEVFGGARAYQRATELAAEARAKREARMTARRAQFDLEDVCRR